LKQSMELARLERVFQRWWPDLRARLVAVPSSVDEHQNRRSDRELIEEILKLSRDKARPAEAIDASPHAYTDNKVPKSAIWKTLHDITDADLARMTLEELETYIAKLKERDRVTPHHAEETGLFHKEQLASAEVSRRKVAETQSPDPTSPDAV